MQDHGVVIVGAGLAAATAAETLRAEGFDGPLTMIGAEEHLPYLRPPLSKGYLAGTEGEDALVVQPPSWYREHDVEVRTGVTALRLDREEQVVTCSDGSSVPYDRLLIATGASSRRIPLPGSDLPGVVMLRTVEESRRLQEALRGGPEPARVVLIGSGWIGMEVAATARSRGAEVTVVGIESVPLSGAIGPELGSLFLRRHRQAGVRFELEQTTSRILAADGRAAGVELGSGARIDADLVVIAVGAVPNVELATEAGLEVHNGVVVDDGLRTSDPRIWAAGDVANAFRAVLGEPQRFEHWANAIATGRRAARSMLGLPLGAEETPYFYTDQFDLGMEYWGYPSLTADARLVLRGDPDSGAVVAFWVGRSGEAEGTVVAAMHVNVWDAQAELEQLVTSRRPVDVATLAEGPERAA
ncbi:MAG TPA: FAD-dependent oxidoreductase [Amnibacterium sp.]|nr:FAD-dependent oxidoreductase [Amnibacterium sp.]